VILANLDFLLVFCCNHNRNCAFI